MTRSTIVLAVAAAAVAFVRPAAAENFVVDKSHTSIVFSISHLGISYTYGMFRSSQGAFSFDRANPAAAQFQFEIDAASLDTMDPKRDEHLRGTDFFSVKQFPKITFVSKSCVRQMKTQPDGSQQELYLLTGTLTMHGVSREVTLPLQYVGEGQGPYGNYRVGFLCRTNLKRSDFGMNYMAGPIGDTVGITVSFEGLRQQQ